MIDNQDNNMISKILIQNNLIQTLTNTCNEYRIDYDNIKANNELLVKQLNEYQNNYQLLQENYSKVETKLSSLSLLYDKLMYDKTNNNDMINVELSSKLVILQQTIDLKDIEIGNNNNNTTTTTTTIIIIITNKIITAIILLQLQYYFYYIFSHYYYNNSYKI